MSEEDNLIEELKRSLKLTENDFLQSEIDDLKEFFIVELKEDNETTEITNETSTTNCDKKTLWLQVSLPITLRNITKEGKEVLNNEKPLISLKIKLKNGECFPVEVTQIKQDQQEEEIKPTEEVEESNTETNSDISDSSDNINNSNDDLRTDETTVEGTCNEPIISK